MANLINESLDQNTEYLVKLQKTFKEVQTCLQSSGNFGIQCAAAVTEKNFRELSFIKNLVYPWRNFDWDYQQFVKNNYDPNLLGVSGDGTYTAIYNNVDILLKLIDGLLVDANPGSTSSASNPRSNMSDLNNCYLLAGGISCDLLNYYKQSYLKQEKPYESSFFDKALDGEYSSSYYVQVGTCPSKIEDKATCVNKGFTWIPNPLYQVPETLRGPNTKPGSCYKGKYAYINNQPGLKVGQLQDLKGLIPSMANDMINMSPDKFMAISAGLSVPGFDTQTCDEPFTNRQVGHTTTKYSIYLVILVFIMLMVVTTLFKS